LVYFGGDGEAVVSPTTIMAHTDKPTKLRTGSMEEAIRMTGLSWPGEHVYIQTDAKNEEEQQRHKDQWRAALKKKVMADLSNRFRASVLAG